MTKPNQEPLEAFPLPEGAILLSPVDQPRTARASVIEALKQAIKEQSLALPIGPETALLDPTRLLSINQFALQLNIAGLMADEISLDLSHWREDQSAPQLTMAAMVDLENDVVAVQGVLTNEELQQLASGQDCSGDALTLQTTDFKGGLNRLLTLVQLLEPNAIGRDALNSSIQRAFSSIVNVGDWLRGQLDDALANYGAKLQPVTSSAFRANSSDNLPLQTQALLTIPLGLNDSNQLVSGSATNNCIERFRLQLIPTGIDLKPTALVVRVCGEMSNELLPDGLILQSKQGEARQSISSANDLQIEITLASKDEMIELTLQLGSGSPLNLPPLKLQ